MAGLVPAISVREAQCPVVEIAGTKPGDYAGGWDMRKIFFSSVLVAFLIVALPPSSAWAQADFYRGKTVTIVTGTRLTGTIGLTAQLVSRHLGRFIPGNPTVILRQMPGGAHLVASGHVYNVPEPDGLTILAANPAIAMAQLAKLKSVRFDVLQYQWLGSTGPDGMLFGIRADLPYKTFKDLQDAKEELIVGTTGPGSNSHDVPLLLKDFAGAKLKLLPGYAANGDIRLALERKEVDGWAALAAGVRRAVDQGVVRPLVRGRAPVAGFENLPVDEDLPTRAVGRSLMAMRGSPLSIGKPYAVRPGTPADRVAILRDAFAKAVNDPTFLAEAATAQIDMARISAEQVTRDFAALMNQTPEALEMMGRYLTVGE
jgi:tripartite-type tricarboxylate transporter receptor subunit TctC